MKINTPVTDKERSMKEGTILVSKTDLKGKITYCNRDFIEVSGFSHGELIGKNHNLVRHPDMPPEAFANLWDTVQAGEPWSGIVKNRCKNGDFYWVHANVSPITEGGRVVEYMSVRTKPTRQQIEEAETLYSKINAGSATLKPSAIAALKSRLRNINTTVWIISALVVCSLVQGGAALALSQGMSNSIVYGLLGTTVVAMLGFGGLTISRILNPLKQASNKLNLMSDGRYFDWVNVDRGDDFGTLLSSIKKTQVRLGFDVMDAREQAEVATRLKTALDQVSTSVMMIGSDSNVIYMNSAAKTMFAAAENDLRKEMSGFNASQMLGESISMFSQHQPLRIDTLEGLSSAAKSTIVVGGRTFNLTANPVNDEQGYRIGTVIEWDDRTTQVSIEQDIEQLVSAARSGDLKRRAKVEGLDGFYLSVGEGMNSVLDTISGVFDELSESMSALASGNLTRVIESDYEGTFGDVKENVNNTISNLEKIVSDIRNATDVIGTASAEIVAGNNNLSQRTEQQAGNLQQTASSMEQITGTVHHNASNAEVANQLAGSAREYAESGGEVVNRAIKAMEEINQSSGRIAEIIGVIDEIAFQTNLLALNASVEAARAGEQGRGFAVVATEVRNLAQRSATAAKEIKDLIQDSVNKVQNGAELVNESGKTLDEIVIGVKKVGDIINEIAAAGKEQSAGIELVNNAVTNMDEVTQQNAALAEETSAASVSMSDKANDVMRLMSFFSTSGRSTGGSSAMSAPSPSVSMAPRPTPSRAPAQPRRPAAEPASPSTSTQSINSFNNDDDEWDEF